MHPAIAQVFRYFAYAHLPPPLQAVSKPFHDLAQALIETLPKHGHDLLALAHFW
jgi:hypothetical protein